MDRIVIVIKSTRLDELRLQHFTESAVKFALESKGQEIDSYQAEYTAYIAALAEIQSQIPSDIPVTTVSREDLPNFLWRDKDLILVCGPDGLFVNLAKYIGNQLVITVNPDPQNIDGVLMLFKPTDVREVITNIQSGKNKVKKLPLAKATIDDDKVIWGVNDIFIGRRDHGSARYNVLFDGRSEHQSSSGIIVSTGIGSTGWIKSIAAMLVGLTRDGMPSKLSSLPGSTDSELVFVVREPFPTRSTGTTIVTARVTPSRPLTVTSEMPTGGCIFSDGILENVLAWNAGSTAVISIGDRFVNLVTP
jgi:NAD kinase